MNSKCLLYFAEEAIELENVYTFQDEQPCTDPVHEYPSTLTENNVPIVIDNGKACGRLKYSTGKCALY